MNVVFCNCIVLLDPKLLPPATKSTLLCSVMTPLPHLFILLVFFLFCFFCLPCFLVNGGKFLSYSQCMNTFSPFFNIQRINVDCHAPVSPLLSLIVFPFPPFSFAPFPTVESQSFSLPPFLSNFTSLTYTLHLSSNNNPLSYAMAHRETCNCAVEHESKQRERWEAWRGHRHLQDRISVT